MRSRVHYLHDTIGELKNIPSGGIISEYGIANDSINAVTVFPNRVARIVWEKSRIFFNMRLIFNMG